MSGVSRDLVFVATTQPRVELLTYSVLYLLLDMDKETTGLVMASTLAALRNHAVFRLRASHLIQYTHDGAKLSLLVRSRFEAQHLASSLQWGGK